MTANSVFNAYLDANIMLVLAACLWALTRYALCHSSLRHAFSLQLQVVYGVMLAVVFTPVVVGFYSLLSQIGLWRSDLVPSLSDVALAQYLSGRFEMAPTTFETLWMWRTVFTQDVTTLGSPLGMAVAGLGIAGIAVFALRLLANVVRVSRLIGQSYVLRRINGIDIRLSDKVTVPFSTRAWRRRYIVLPSALLSDADDLRIAVSHELQHMRQGDLGWEIALEALRPLFFWNPAFAYFKREVDELRELACDQQVLLRRRFGVGAYCDCLLRVCRDALGQGTRRQVLMPSVPLVSSERNRRAARFLKRRVVSMTSQRRPLPGRWVTGLLVVPLLAVISVGAIASQGSGDWSQDRLMLSTIVNLERLDQRTLANPY
ncbi:M56 family metallopeptidase [Roseovarius aestuarii]|uniref:BlaR1 peptidase M56 n=1 Tax=Roseovarius aestuarii TaxID=475083 RepID=A0A1X7BPZ1_9RHOB|nr:M56 family metallopeptidase [Roseovarius aestuarii]SMC11673.1 BlaR1 peptidase M56 [Roseovarius aestuarii]